jgi:hypothetical protein
MRRPWSSALQKILEDNRAIKKLREEKKVLRGRPELLCMVDDWWPEVDPKVDQAIDNHFSKRELKTTKIFITPNKRK